MTTVIYHSADFDGIFCREIAKKFLGEKDVQYIGWNFGDLPIAPMPNGRIYILDLPVDKPFGFDWSKLADNEVIDANLLNCLIWIDHHKSSIETLPNYIPGYRIDGVAACRLAWQWFTNEYGPNNPHCHPAMYNLPTKQDFIDRKVSEPLAVRLAGEYDVLTRGKDGNLLPDLWEFQCGLRSRAFLDFDDLLSDGTLVPQLIKDGKVADAYGSFLNAEMMAEAGFILEWEGLKFLAVNNAGRGHRRFASTDKPETGHDALLSFGYTNKRIWTVSLYHAKHRTDLDLSQIAVKHGGGGHKGACGFTCKQLPFSL